MRISPPNITSLKPNEIFVFGSNLAGRHGRGAALQAIKFGAIYGQGKGLAGQTYAIATKDLDLRPIKLYWIEDQIQEFLQFTDKYLDKHFLVTEIGCGLAGFRPSQIAPLFGHKIPENVSLPENFWASLR